MAIEEHKALIRRFNEEVWNRGNLAVVDEVFATDWVWHSAPPGMPPTREGLRQLVSVFQAAFSEIRASVDDQIGEGQSVAWRWRVQATHVGEFMGIAPTDRQITFTGISIDRLANGIFQERWDSADTQGLLQQLGALPAPA